MEEGGVMRKADILFRHLDYVFCYPRFQRAEKENKRNGKKRKKRGRTTKQDKDAS